MIAEAGYSWAICSTSPGGTLERPRKSSEEITVYKNAGGAHLDLMVAAALAGAAGAGRNERARRQATWPVAYGDSGGEGADHCLPLYLFGLSRAGSAAIFRPARNMQTRRSARTAPGRVCGSRLSRASRRCNPWGAKRLSIRFPTFEPRSHHQLDTLALRTMDRWPSRTTTLTRRAKVAHSQSGSTHGSDSGADSILPAWFAVSERRERMVSLTFPDGNAREFDAGATGADVAESIAKSLVEESGCRQARWCAGGSFRPDCE